MRRSAKQELKDIRHAFYWYREAGKLGHKGARTAVFSMLYNETILSSFQKNRFKNMPRSFTGVHAFDTLRQTPYASQRGIFFSRSRVDTVSDKIIRKYNAIYERKTVHTLKQDLHSNVCLYLSEAGGRLPGLFFSLVQDIPILFEFFGFLSSFVLWLKLEDILTESYFPDSSFYIKPVC